MKIKILTLLLCCFSLVSVWSQTVSGTIKSTSGFPLVGVNIVSQGTSNGAITNFDGGFEIKAVPGAILNITYVGYRDQNVTVGTGTTLDIVLIEDISELDEVVIIGYGSQKKESVLGAINQVKGAELLETGSANVTNALNGLTPGVTVVQTTGEPGGDDGDIFIRGNADPLILVDGVEIVGGFSNMDPRDVESISTLKDGAATAVYGIRGANGVVIITTKRGKIGKPKVSLTSEFSVKLYPDSYDSLDAFTAQSLRNVGVFNDADFSNAYTSQEDLDAWEAGNQPYLYPNTDWIQATTKDYVTSFNQSVSVRGGSDFVKYFVSASYLQDGDIFEAEQNFNFDPTYKFERYSFRGNLDFTLSETTTLKTSISNRLEDKNKAGGITSSTTGFRNLYTAAPGTIPFYPAEALELYPDPLYPGLAEVRFPITSGFGNNLTGSTNLLKTIFSIDFELEQLLDFVTDGLKFTGKYNYISSYESNRQIGFDSSIVPRIDKYDLLRDGTWDSFEGINYERPFDFNIGNENINSNSEIQYVRAQLNYNRSFDKHNVTGLAIFSRNKKITNTQFPFFNEDWIGRATYNYDSRYFFEVSGSYNGDETFNRGLRFKLFPSFALGVNLAKENFIKNNVPDINNLKIRYSYGETGSKAGLRVNNVLNRWQYLSFFDYPTGNTNTRDNSRFFFGEGDTPRLNLLEEDQIGNTQLTWATVIKQNIGVDFGVFNNKVSGTVDFFKDRREGTITRLQNVPLYFGSSASLPFGNLNITESHGYELSLTYKNKTSGGFAYSATAFYGFNENRVIVSAADAAATPQHTQVAGKAIGARTALQVDGYFQNIDELVNYPSYSGTPGLGDYRYIDYNANGSVIGSDQEDQIRFDLPTAPRNSYSLKLSGSYKSWSISTLINGIEGHKGFEDPNLIYALPAGVAAGREEQLDYWTPTNTDAQYPALHVGTANPNLASVTTDRIVDLDYIKLRSINVAYKFDTSNIKGISDLKLYVSGNNLVTISELKYRDPEGNNTGAYPTLKRFNLGLNLTF